MAQTADIVIVISITKIVIYKCTYKGKNEEQENSYCIDSIMLPINAYCCMHCKS